MSYRFYGSRRSGKQSFPVRTQGNLPVEALLVRYICNLLPHAPLHTEFLEMVYELLDVKPSARVVGTVFKSQASRKHLTALDDLGGADDLARVTLDLLDEQGSCAVEKRLRSGLIDLLKKRRAFVSQSAGGYEHRTKRLCKLLDLTQDDLAVLECFACHQTSGLFGAYCNSYPPADWIALISVALDLPLLAVKERIGRGGTLESKGLVEISSTCIEMHKSLLEYLTGLSSEFLSADDFELLKRGGFSLESFPIPPQERELLIRSLRSPAPCHLFFYGRAGTGKTELAKALAAETGRQVFLVKYGENGGERERCGALTATLGVAPPDAVVIIDEADNLLNTMNLYKRNQIDKGWINHFMDECRHKVVWIANESDRIETSVLRRFSYSLEFKKFTTAQRESVWKTHLRGHALARVIRPAMVRRLARDYETDAGGIASALKAAEHIFTGRLPDADDAEQTLTQLLGHHEKLSGVQRSNKKLNRLNPHYDAAALNTDFSSAELISALEARQQNIEKGHRPFSANILFWGLPGTGKTEFAKYLAQELDKELLVKRMSDLQSMYVGQTEKQIAAAFEEADREGAVLFLDEADSLILDRKTASRSWEASQTNEVLTQMENFTGICICCTNLLDHLDESALRRFTWKIKFLPLTDEGKEALFRKYFQPSGRLSSTVIAGLQQIRDLTPGDFKTVWERHQYGWAGLDTPAIVETLRQEAAYKRTRCSAPIGFQVK